MVTPPHGFGRLLLGGARAAGESPTFDWWYAAASIGLVGGILYWYLDERPERR